MLVFKKICKVAVLFLLFLIFSCDEAINNTDNNLMNWNVPQHPYMAQDGMNNVHNDAYMTDTYNIKGPEKDSLQIEILNLKKLFITICFDKNGLIKTIGLAGDGSRVAYLIDPINMSVKDSFNLPRNPLIGVAGGSYFYLDNQDRMVIPTINNHIYILNTDNATSKFVLEQDYNLTTIPQSDQLMSVLPDWNGNLWFITEKGLVGIIDKSGNSNTLLLSHNEGTITIKESITNSFAVDETGGIFIVSDYALYRIDSDINNNPIISWRELYDWGTYIKPSQFSQGSGTTPTLIGKDYIAITDNAEPQMNVLIFKRKKENISNRLLCKVPVFSAGASANENSLIAFNNSIIVENNFGYTHFNNFTGKLSEPGMTRIDFYPNGKYNIIWQANERIPSVVSKYSKVNGIVYTYTKESDGWYFVALNGHTGLRKFRTKVGNDSLVYNNHYSGIAIHKNGSAFVSCIGGLYKFF